MNASRVLPKSHVMQAVMKDKQGKGSARALRNAGMVPAVVYAPGEEALSVAVNAKDLAKCLQIGRFFTSTQELALPKGAMKVLARDIQRHPLTDMPIHVDFMKYNASSKVHVDVTVVITGEKTSPGMKEGGVIQLIESTIEVVCRADSIPQEIVVDISKLGIGDSIHLSEITLPAGVKSAVVDRDLTIVSVVSTRTSATAEDEAAEAAAAAATAAAAAPADGKAPAAAGAAAPAAAGAKPAAGAAAPAAAKAADAKAKK